MAQDFRALRKFPMARLMALVRKRTYRRDVSLGGKMSFSSLVAA
jgi:hypothetical protein